MAAQKSEAANQKKILVLCVDRDCDLEKKTGIKTPLIGRDANLNAAVDLALNDPEEADANAMFESIRVYDTLQNEGHPNEVFEVATISGSELGGVGADRKIVAELNELMSFFPTNEIILVTDGYMDEAVLPLVESRVPVSSVRRIVVKHSKSIEESAALVIRYFKMLLENPRYSRIVLGLPGVLLLILGILSLYDLLYYYWMAFIFVLGSFLLVKGFGADRFAKNLYKWIKNYSPPSLTVQISTFTAIAGILCIGVGVYLGYVATSDLTIPPGVIGWISVFPQLAGVFVKSAADLLVVGICLLLLGKVIRCYFDRDIKLLRNVALIVTIGWSRQILEATSDVLISPRLGYEKLIFSIGIGILIGLASFLTVIVVHRLSRGFFKETEDQIGELGET